jgi:competence protein ComEC
VLLIGGWLSGVALGVMHVRGEAILLLLSILLFLLWHWQVRLPFVVTSIGLFLLGNIYGVFYQGTSSRPCDLSAVTTVTVSYVQRITERRATYVVTTSSGCRWILVAPRVPLYDSGTTLSLSGPPQPVARLSADDGYKAWLQRRGITAILEYPTITVIAPASSARMPSARQVIDERLQYIFVEPELSFVRAMLLAAPVALPPALEANFKATGVSHILAISGMNISLMTGMLLAVISVAPLRPLARSLTTLSLVWLYMVLINLPVSAVRASFFWSIALLALRLGLLVSLPTAIILTATLMISYNPALLLDVGWQLSMAAVVGIGVALFIWRGVPELRPAWLKWLAAALLVTGGATVMTWPLVAYHFGTISFISVIANLLIEPMFPLMLAGSLVTLVISFIVPPLAVFGSFIVRAGYQWMDLVTSLLARLPGAYVTDITLPGWSVGLYYVVVLGALVWLIRYQRRSWREMWQ